MKLITGEIHNTDRSPVILIHGGAWDIPDDECESHVQGIKQALSLGEAVLNEGSSSEDVVVRVLTHMENSGVFDAGCGAVLTNSGEVELDAGIMYGDSKQWGAVAGIKHFRNPTQIANQIALRGYHQYCFLANTYAEDFAIEVGFRAISNDILISQREKDRYEKLLSESNSYHTSHPFLTSTDEVPRGTIGCVVMDGGGRLVAGTSTGGTPFRKPGRIGDSPLPGCGYFANQVGAASATGWGEAIAAVSLCREAVGHVEHGATPIESVSNSLTTMYEVVKNLDGDGATGGLILLDAHGRGAWAYTTPRMARGWGQPGKNQRFIKVT